MGGQRAIVQLSREDVGGCILTAAQTFAIASASADGRVSDSVNGSTIEHLRKRGLMANGCLNEKGLRVRAKLKGLGDA